MAVEKKTAEVTISFVKWPEGAKKYGAIACKELKETEGKEWVSVERANLKQFEKGEVCMITYEKTPEGYLNNAKKVGVTSAPPKQNIRPATNPVDSDRMGTMGMVNAFIACGRVTLDADEISRAIDLCHDALMRSKLHGGETQRRDDMNDKVPY